MAKLKELLLEKYGSFVVETLLNDKEEVLLDKSYNKESQNEVKAHLDLTVKNLLKDLPLEKMNIPYSHVKEEIKEGQVIFEKMAKGEAINWGMDFSSWLGNFSNPRKDIMIVGAEPNVGENDFQLVYDFGSRSGEEYIESARKFAKKEEDIWHTLTNLFVDDLENDNKVLEFLSRCYITDMCHIVPQKCGMIKGISKKLLIEQREWKKFRIAIAHKFLISEIFIIRPKLLILHGAVSREFIRHYINGFRNPEIKISPRYNIRVGDWEIDEDLTIKVIAIPHLKGSNKNVVWRNKETVAKAKQVITEIKTIL